jgi:hypothetical protein
VDRGQKLGGILGLLTLLAAFVLPFSSIAEGSAKTVDSLLLIFKIFVIGVSNLQTIGLTQLAELAYVYMAAFIAIIVAGVVGAYPRWSAFLGAIGMVTLTFSPFVVFTSYNILTTGFGYGFWVLWATTILTIFAAFLSRRERKRGAPKIPQSPVPTPGQSG